MEESSVYFDTFVFMDILSGNAELAKKAENYIRNNKGIVSSVLLTEIGFHVGRRKFSKIDETLFYLQSLENVEITDVTPEISVLAGRLRARYIKKLEKNLTYFDSIHLATAIINKCTKFITGDKGFKDIKEIEIEIY